eukprot:c33673_g1_i1 orf=2-223(-)
MTSFTLSSKSPKSFDWSWWDEVVPVGVYKAGGSRHWTCKYCRANKTGSATRIRAHLLHLSGADIAFCRGISTQR